MKIATYLFPGSILQDFTNMDSMSSDASNNLSLLFVSTTSVQQNLNNETSELSHLNITEENNANINCTSSEIYHFSNTEHEEILPPLCESIENNTATPTNVCRISREEDTAVHNCQKSDIIMNTTSSTNCVINKDLASNENNNEDKEVCKRSMIRILLELLECPVCLNHMSAPIIFCENGHNICSNCRPFICKCPLCRRPFLKTRNIALELIAREVRLTDEYQYLKDDETDIENILQNNSLSNSLQLVNVCPLTFYTHCYWQGNPYEIRNHIEEFHPHKILSENDSNIWELALTVRDLKVIFALENIFLYKLKLDTMRQRFFIQVFHIGPGNNYDHFIYHVRLSSKANKQNIIMRNTAMPFTELEQESSYSPSNCAVLDYCTVQDISKAHDMKYALILENSTRDETRYLPLS